MIAVIFEVCPRAEHEQDYLDVAADLRAELEALPGFISIERFRSINDPDKILSLSFFENEEAIHTWRNTAEHRKAQALGRQQYFSDYRLRIAQVWRDYGMHNRAQAPADSQAAHADI